ncbi:hypothetical protein ACIQM4_25230 [Streptomyces sp. NPDC091272]|uniref:hypothetical protein n=1 Tax=Streptomyces sp. NPDC091272 TaxID=3365981 RepID=UPI0038008D67
MTTKRVHAVLNAVIAAHSGRIGAADDPQTARAWRAQRAPPLIERDVLTADGRERIAEILRDMPALLAVVREEPRDE